MTYRDSNEAVLALDDVLDRERNALMSGDLELISRLVEAKNAIIDRLNIEQPTDTTCLQRIQKKLDRNNTLLNSAKEGIRYVADRIRAMKEATEQFETYDRNGFRKNIRMRKYPGVERRS